MPGYYIPHFHPSPQLIDKLCALFLYGLDGKEKEIMEMRLGGIGLDHGMTCSEIGVRFGVSKAWAAESEHIAFAKVQNLLQTAIDVSRRPAYTLPLKDLGLSLRVEMALLKAGIKWADQLQNYTPAQLRVIGGVGITGMKDIVEKMREAKLGMRIDLTGEKNPLRPPK